MSKSSSSYGSMEQVQLLSIWVASKTSLVIGSHCDNFQFACDDTFGGQTVAFREFVVWPDLKWMPVEREKVTTPKICWKHQFLLWNWDIKATFRKISAFWHEKAENFLKFCICFCTQSSYLSVFMFSEIDRPFWLMFSHKKPNKN